MSDIAIKVEGLGKQYRIGQTQEAYRIFRDTMANAVLNPFRKVGNLLRGQVYGTAGLKESIARVNTIFPRPT